VDIADIGKWILGAIGVTSLASAGGTRGVLGPGGARSPSAGADFGFEGDLPMRGVLTPAREALFRRAMHERKSPEAFEGLAVMFEKLDLPIEAKMLRARGRARAADAATHEKRREVIRKLMQSKDPVQVERGADICERDLGMTAAAGHLRDYARGLRQAEELSRRTGRPLTGPGGPDGPAIGGSDPAYGPRLDASGECLIHRGTGSGGCLMETPDTSQEIPDVSDAPSEEGAFNRNASPMGVEPGLGTAAEPPSAGAQVYVYPPEAEGGSSPHVTIDTPQGERVKVDATSPEGQSAIRQTLAWMKEIMADATVIEAYAALLLE